MKEKKIKTKEILRQCTEKPIPETTATTLQIRERRILIINYRILTFKSIPKSINENVQCN